jgi:hypothetical protein
VATLAEAELVDEQAERQQAVDDRRHAGQVADVDLDDVGHPVARRVFLEVDAGGHAERHGDSGGDDHHQAVPTQAERMPAWPARREGNS